MFGITLIPILRNNLSLWVMNQEKFAHERSFDGDLPSTNTHAENELEERRLTPNRKLGSPQTL